MKQIADIRLIAVDLDGTLLTPDKRVTERTVRALNACREQGVLLVFNTGRTLEGCMEYMRLLSPDAAVLNYGAHVLVRGQTVFRRFMTATTAARVLRGIGEARKIRFQTDRDLRYSDDPLDGCLPFDRSDDVPGRVSYLCAWDLPEETARFVARETGCCLSQLVGSRWCNFSPRGCGKESGMKRVFRALGLPPGCGLGFGDENCDLGFFRVCGTGVAMADADAETLAAASFRTDGCGEDGVAAFLEEYLLRETLNGSESAAKGGNKHADA